MGLTNAFGKKPAGDCQDGSGLMFPHSELPSGGGREEKPGRGAGGPQGGRASTTERGLVVVQD